MQRNQQAGFNLIEAAIVLGIVGLVVGGIWAAAAAAYENMRQQQASKGVLALAQAVKSYYAGTGSATIGSEAQLVSTINIVPKDMVSGNSIVHPLGGNTTAANQVTISSANGNFVVTLQGISDTSCRAFVARNINNIRAVASAITLNGADIMTGATTLNAGCNAGAAGNAIAFTFSIQG
jgi:type II secretory pathway pseudopilin PulG